MTHLLALTAALTLALAGYAGAQGAGEPCITVIYNEYFATPTVTGAGVITTIVSPIPPDCS